jgi:site-specific recombinase XerD
MSGQKLESDLADKMPSFIELRRLSGTDYQSQSRLLAYFDRFLVERGITEMRMNRQIIDAYQQTLSHLRPRTRENRMSVVRQFCQYLARTDPQCYIPEPLRGIRSDDISSRHIYSMAEIRALLAAALKLPPSGSLRARTYWTLLGLLYSTGVRIGEGLALNLEDFHCDQQCLWIAKGKFRKARWVPLSSSTCDQLQRYIHLRREISPGSPDSPLFLNQCSRRLNYVTVSSTFRKLLKQSGIPHHKRTGPRLHDLRHTFAVHRLLAWYTDGEEVNARLPWLATYMGHVDVHCTQVYLRPTTELMEIVHGRFHHHYLHRVKSLGESS